MAITRQEDVRRDFWRQRGFREKEERQGCEPGTEEAGQYRAKITELLWNTLTV